MRWFKRLICKLKGHMYFLDKSPVLCSRCKIKMPPEISEKCYFSSEKLATILREQAKEDNKEIWILPSIEEQIKNDIYEDKQ